MRLVLWLRRRFKYCTWTCLILGIIYYLLRSVWHVLSWVRGLILLETPLRRHAFVVVPIHVGGLRVGYRDDHRLYLLFSVTPHSIIVLLVCQQAFF